LEEALGGLRVKRKGRGWARRGPKGVDAGAADDAKAIREGLRRWGIRAGIPRNPRRGKRTQGGRRAFWRRKADRRARSRVERFFGWRKGGLKVDRSAREVALHLPGLRPPRLLPHRLESFDPESFEMSSIPKGVTTLAHKAAK